MYSQHCKKPQRGPTFLSRGLLLLLLTMMLASSPAAAEQAPDFYAVLPPDIEGWKKSERPEHFDNSTLYGYIDGGAELYISFGFKQLTSVDYVSQNDGGIKVDIFDMGDSYNAFGVFSQSRETVSARFGQGSDYAAGFLSFWKGRYYIALSGYPETEKKRQALEKIGEVLDRSIPKRGPLPPIVAGLPTDGLVPESVRYARHHVWLDSYYVISQDNILHIDPMTNAVLAKYTKPGRHILLLILYPDARQAERAVESFLQKYPPTGKSRVTKQDNGRFAGIGRIGTSVSVVLDAADAKTARSALARALRQEKAGVHAKAK